VRIGTAERKDLWEAEKRRGSAQPGPGGYLNETSTLSKRGVAIGLPREEKVEARPGPGDYDADASRNLSPTKGSVRMGTAKRKDIWEDQIKAASVGPGAGAYI
jgi:hypothetical protein